MADTFSKRQKEKKKLLKKKLKAQRREERKQDNDKGKDFEDMIAYVDANGNLTDTPPDEQQKVEVSAEDIDLNYQRETKTDTRDTGVVISFFENKGFGFIKDDVSGDNIFVHHLDSIKPLSERMKVSFKKERSPKGFQATSVEVID
ncbi:cold shock domain-containing protein [Zunongwangia sp. SCSIO 43204]|uniref:Cold shock protein, CspA family n=1 Tax=Zunongwangia mangrovi TaxID=1334022 RepID=A0A1I1MLD3_9FLAO|nr:MULTISPECIES: cold shock domain-containing protein [Zunongwangia]UAB83042.1 cold shock domain-containing protein [Zunongwangia sp. SCSIO 43204]SFC83998.1 Cold shock protein, CspA family [Zunongwangia mangrovi]